MPACGAGELVVEDNGLIFEVNNYRARFNSAPRRSNSWLRPCVSKAALSPRQQFGPFHGMTDMPASTIIRVRLERSPQWVEVALSLGEPFEGGRLIEYPESFSSELSGADELAASYGLNNWESGIIDGALYAFRGFYKLSRSRVLLSELKGSLRAQDLPALAYAVTIGVMRSVSKKRGWQKIVDQKLAEVEFPGWIIEWWQIDNGKVRRSSTALKADDQSRVQQQS